MLQDLWLVAHDLSAYGDAAAFDAARLANALKAPVRVLHVHAIPHMNAHEQTGEETFRMQRELGAQLETVARSLREQFPGLVVETEVVAGDAAERVVAEAARLKAGTIVVGTHGRRGIQRVVLGSVAERIVHEATCPVLVVKPRNVP